MQCMRNVCGAESSLCDVRCIVLTSRSTRQRQMSATSICHVAHRPSSCTLLSACRKADVFGEIEMTTHHGAAGIPVDCEGGDAAAQGQSGGGRRGAPTAAPRRARRPQRSHPQAQKTGLLLLTAAPKPCSLGSRNVWSAAPWDCASVELPKQPRLSVP